MTYTEVSVVIDGWTDEVAEFTHDDFVDEFVETAHHAAMDHGYVTEVFLLVHDHDVLGEDEDDCECALLVTDHHPSFVWNVLGDDEWEGLACSDCVMLIANGEVPEASSYRERAAIREHVAEVDRRIAGYHVSVGGERGFSWQSCDVCGSHLGGDRHQVIGTPVGEEK